MEYGSNQIRSLAEESEAGGESLAPKPILPRFRLARASGTVAALTLLSRVLGLVRDMVIARFFGAGFTTDALFVAFKVPIHIGQLIIEGSLSTAFIPIFTRELAVSSRAGKFAVGAITVLTLIVTFGITLAGIAYAPELVALFAPGFSENADKSTLAIGLMQLMFPYIILVSLLGLFSSVLNTLGYFALPAAAPAILNIVLIIGVIVFSGSLEQPVYSLILAMLIGGTIALAPQLFLAHRKGFGFHLRSPLQSRAVSSFIRLMIPNNIAVLVYHFTVLMNLLLASMLIEGSISWLYYADRLFKFPFGIFSLAVATAALPALAQSAAARDKQLFNEQLSSTLRWVTFVTIPASAGLCALANPVAAVIYEGGLFDPSDTPRTAHALIAYSIGLWSLSCQFLLFRAFLAKKNSIIPAVIACLSFFVHISVAILLIGRIDGHALSTLSKLFEGLHRTLDVSHFGYLGLPLAASATSLFATFALIMMLPRIDAQLDIRGLTRTVLQTMIATGVMLAAIRPLTTSLTANTTLLLFAIPLGAASFAAVALALRSEEAIRTWQLLSRYAFGSHRQTGQLT